MSGDLTTRQAEAAINECERLVKEMQASETWRQLPAATSKPLEAMFLSNLVLMRLNLMNPEASKEYLLEDSLHFIRVLRRYLPEPVIADGSRN